MKNKHSFTFTVIFLFMAVPRTTAMMYLLCVTRRFEGQGDGYLALILMSLFLLIVITSLYVERLLGAAREQLGLPNTGIYHKNYTGARASLYVYFASLLNSALTSAQNFDSSMYLTLLEYSLCAMPIATFVLYIAIETGSLRKFSDHCLH